jgi:Rrf2 family iron-sulfur cluster assembly transcriptional regulator
LKFILRFLRSFIAQISNLRELKMALDWLRSSSTSDPSTPPPRENTMRVTTKGRFAVNAAIDLALRQDAGPVALASIAERQRISLSYLEQLFARLKRAGIVESTRGPGGGYTLGRPAAAISVADIVGAVDEPPEHADGEAAADTQPLELWRRLDAVMLVHMGQITLESLVADQIARGVTVETRPTRRAIAPQPVVKPVRTTAPNSVFAFGRTFAR